MAGNLSNAHRCHRQQMRDMLVVREQRKTDANVWQPVVEGPRCHRSGGCIHGSDGAGVAGAAAEAEMRVSRAMRYDNAVQQHVIQAWLDWLIQQEVRHQNKAVQRQRQTEQFHAADGLHQFSFSRTARSIPE